VTQQPESGSLHPCLVAWGAPREAQRQLIAIPHGVAGAGVFRTWPSVLEDVAVYGVRFPGRESRLGEPASPNIVDLVDELYGALEARRPFLPTIIYGQSSGALVAFELARRLERSGLPLELLCVTGQLAPNMVVSEPSSDSMSLGDVVRVLRAFGTTPEPLLESREFLELIRPTVAADIQVVRRYQYISGSPLRTPIIAFLGDGDRFVRAADVEGWALETSSAFELRMFEGGHLPLQESVEIPQAIADAISRGRPA
jgi:surfactin synthase thioesterase subunit